MVITHAQNVNRHNNFWERTMIMKKFLCVLLLISFSFMFFGCTNSQTEENEWLKNKVSGLEKENAELEAEIARLKSASYTPQNTTSNNDDFQYLLECYGEVCYELEKTADEIGSIVEELGYADTQTKRENVIQELYALQDAVYKASDEYGDIYSHF